MMIIKKINKRINLIKEGRNHIDKIKIFLWLFGIKNNLYLKNNGKIYAFEPEPENLKACYRNLSLNKIKNVKIIPLACSDKKESLSFYLDDKNSGGHSLVKKTKNKIKIKADTLDNIAKENSIKNIKLIKIDVEGSEMKVFNGIKKTLKKFHPRIIFETDFIDDVSMFLKKFNYKIKKISKRDYFAE